MTENTLTSLLQYREPGTRPLAPDLTEWLRLDISEIRKKVEAAELSMVMSADGTRRYVLLRSGGFEVDAKRYLEIAGLGLHNMLSRLFAHGMSCVISPFMPATAFERGDKYSVQGLQACHHLLFTDDFADLYRKYDMKVRLFGAFRNSLQSTRVRDLLESLDQRLTDLTPVGSRLLLCGFLPVSTTDELLAQIPFFQTAGNLRAAVCQACFPHGPEKVDIAVTYDHLRVTDVLPAILDRGTSVYHFNDLPFELTDHHLRLILYDHLVQRPSSRHDLDEYSKVDLEELRWSQKHRETLEGLSNGTLRQIRGMG